METNLKDEIEALKGNIEELSRKAESDQLEIIEITKLHTFSKGRVAELEDSIDEKEQQIEKLKSSNEELWGQIRCLRGDKQDLTSTLDNHELLLKQRNIEIEVLESRLSSQEETLNNCKRRNNQLTQLQDQTLKNKKKMETQVNLHEGHLQKRAAKVLRTLF